MIRAQKSRLFTKFFAAHVEARIARTFNVRIRGLEPARARAESQSIVIVANHSAWWDALVAIYVAVRLFRADAYAMMDAKNLRKFPFFSRVGAFGVDLDDAADGARSIRYCAKLLRNGPTLLWLFPQGREVPLSAPSLGFRGGVAPILRLASSAAAIPLAIRYEFGEAEKPTLWLSFGPTIARASETGADEVALYEEAVTCELARIDRAILHHEAAEFTALHEERESAVFAFAQRMLSLLVGPRRLE